jgi:hypothetical protein
MYDITFYIFIIILIVIIVIYVIFNNLLSIYNFDLFEFFDLCSLKNKENKKMSNIKSQTKKEIIIGYDKDNNPIKEEILVNQYCNLENEICLVDPEGNNTCCNGLKCIRKSDNYQYKVCSTKNEKDYSCSYNKFVCNIHLFEKLFEKNWKIFIDKFHFNKDHFNKMKSKVKNHINSLCGSQKLSEQEKNDIINFNLNAIFNEGFVFAKPVRSIKFN